MKRFKLYVIRAIIKCEVPQKRRRGLWHLSRQAAAAYASKALTKCQFCDTGVYQFARAAS